jgi:hypothetical protein
MTYLVERLTELRRHLDHLREDRVVEALDDLDPIEGFLEVARQLVADLPNP